MKTLVRQRADALLRAWDGFWLSPGPTSTLAVVRVAYGLLLLTWALMLAFDLSSFFSTSGILPEGPDIPWAWSPVDTVASDTFTVALFWLLVVAAACLVLGFHSRLAAVLAFVVAISLHRPNPWVFQAGDMALRVFSFYFIFAPAGTALSIDRWRRCRATFWEFPQRSLWALRLIQVQLSVIYLSSVWTKVRGTTWNDGTAVSYALAHRRAGSPRVAGPDHRVAGALEPGHLRDDCSRTGVGCPDLEPPGPALGPARRRGLPPPHRGHDEGRLLQPHHVRVLPGLA